MKKVLFSLLFLICSSTLFAQMGCIDCDPDSLVKQLHSKLSDADRLYTLVALIDMIVLPENPDSALHCINQILKLNNRLKLINKKPHELIRDGLVLWKKNEGDSAIGKFKDAISAFDEQKKIMGNNNEYNRIVATDTLKSKAEMTIITAADGQEAIELLNQKDFDLVLMDVQMPGMDGFEETKYIREHFSSPKKDVPIIALTARCMAIKQK